MYVLRWMIGLFVIFNLIGCCPRLFKTPEGIEVACPCCKPSVKYYGTNFTIKGITIPHAPVQMGEVTVDQKTLQTACDAVQIMDQHRLFTCEMLPSLATSSKARFDEAVDAMQKDEVALTQFALIISTKDGAAIQEYVKFYGPQVQNLKTAMVTSETREPSTKAYAGSKPLKSLTIISSKVLLK